MLFRIIAVLAFFGAVSAGVDPTKPACVSENEVMMNEMVAGLQTDLNDMMSDPPTQEEIQAILNLVCNDTTIKGIMQSMQTTVGTCFDLINATDLKTLKLGNLQFTDLFVKFVSVDNFCVCVPSLLGVMSLEQMKTDVVLMNNDAEYKHVINFTYMCNPPQGFNMSNTLNTLKDNVQNCPKVFDYNEVFKTTNIVQAAHLTSKCRNYVNVESDFTCAIASSKQDKFKMCITAAGTTTSDSSTKCARRKCVDNYISCNEAARDVYLWSVEVKNPNTFPLGSECDTATSATVSLILLVSAAIYSMFFAN